VGKIDADGNRVETMTGDEARRIYDKLEALGQDLVEVKVELGKVVTMLDADQSMLHDHEGRLRKAEHRLGGQGKISAAGAASGVGSMLWLAAQKFFGLG